MKQIAINGFLAVHIIAIACWCVPLDSPLIAALRNEIRPYFLWSGLFQSWDMFAPSPKSVNSYIDAVVIYTDGHVRKWKFPQMEQLSLSERYFEERYRKFIENLKEDKNVALWPDAARGIARRNNDVLHPPQFVILMRHWSDIVPCPNERCHPQPWHVQIFYEYTVRPGDLR